MHERRRHIRVEVEKERPISVHINGLNFLDILTVIDISEGGICIAVAHMFEGCRIDQSVTLVITLPPPMEYDFLVTAKIRHMAGEKFGVQFLDLKRRDRARIRCYVASRLAAEPWLLRLKHRLHLI